jgi:ferric-dicitrate binding protein FerR (iron transport regulator)
MKALDRIVQEARAELGTREAGGVDWRAVDEALFDRLDEMDAAEERAKANHAKASSGWRAGAWLLAAAGMAAAVTIAMVGGRGGESHLLEGARPSPARASVATVLSAGAVVGGSQAAAGAELHVGDAIEARESVRAEAPGKAWLLLEGGSHTRVAEQRSPLVLELEVGALEADVVPVAEGEAFAVDVGGVRVAVHGTHLRVARNGDRVTVDLSEGVVSVGPAPRRGSTLGPLVTAPAHLEFSIADPAGTLSVSHDPGSVRTPVALRANAQPTPIVAVSPPAVTHSETAHASPPAATVVARVEPHPPAPAVGEPSAASAAPPPLPAVDPDAEATLAAAVRACMPSRSGTENVTLSMNTTLHLELEDSGMVRSARFDPPVAVAVNECSAPTIYKTRFGRTGTVAVPIGVIVPSSGEPRRTAPSSAP